MSKEEKLIWKLRCEFVGPRGPIETVYFLDSSQSSFSPSSYAYTAKYIIYGTKDEGWAGGSDENPLIAELKAIMEALERWASGVLPEKKLIKSSANKLGNRAINPQEVVKYALKQYRRKLFSLIPFSRNNTYFWKSVLTLPEKQVRYLPVDCLYYPVTKKFTPSLYTFASSSGVAAGFSFEDAVKRGLYEAVERDAFMITWLNRLKLPKIRNETLSRKGQLRIRDFEKLGYKVYLVNITFDLVPVILAIVVNANKKSALLVSGAANFNIGTAISKSLDEVEYILSWQLRYSDRIRNLNDSRKARGVLDHIAVYSSKDNLSKAKFLWEGPEVDFSETPSISEKIEYRILMELFKAKEKKILIADLTPPVLKRLGIWVVKSMPLGLIPISFGYGLEALGMSRLDQVQRRNPWPKNNPFLHPFA